MVQVNIWRKERCVCVCVQLAVPVQLQDDRAVHDGETQEANPPQEDTAKHTGMEVQDHDLESGGTGLETTHTHTHSVTCLPGAC